MPPSIILIPFAVVVKEFESASLFTQHHELAFIDRKPYVLNVNDVGIASRKTEQIISRKLTGTRIDG